MCCRRLEVPSADEGTEEEPEVGSASGYLKKAGTPSKDSQ
jgi:hypothetical protein